MQNVVSYPDTNQQGLFILFVIWYSSLWSYKYQSVLMGDNLLHVPILTYE